MPVVVISILVQQQVYIANRLETDLFHLLSYHVTSGQPLVGPLNHDNLKSEYIDSELLGRCSLRQGIYLTEVVFSWMYFIVGQFKFS